MPLPQLPHWATDETLVETPPVAKQGKGAKPGLPEAAQYINWLMSKAWKALRGVQHQYSDIVVGTQTDVDEFRATHAIGDDWAGDVVTGSRITFISSGTLTGDEVVTADSEEILTAPGVVLSFSTFSLELSGDWRVLVGGGGVPDRV